MKTAKTGTCTFVLTRAHVSYFALLTSLLLLCACGRSGSIGVGSKNFIEQLLLGELAAQQLERTLHVHVDRKLNLGGTLLAHGAIVKGDIDIYPEYTGTAITVVLGESGSADSLDVYRRVRAAYEQRFHLRWLEPLGFNDTFAMVVRSADAARLSQPTLSAARARNWRLGVGYEFLTRPDGLRSLDKSYDLTWEGAPKNMDLGLLYQALDQRQIDMGAANSTDGQLSAGKFTVLRDDRKTFPPYNACFIVREELLVRKPEVAWALGLLRDRVSDDAMRRMNQQVVMGHAPVEKVIKDFLETLDAKQ